MGEIVLKCKFITPAFIYDGDNNLELRSTSIKGLMRFWWRASYIDFRSLEEMRNRESEIFGGKIIQEGKEKFIKAKVQISAEFDKDVKVKKIQNKNLFDKNNLKGCEYLFYSMKFIGDNKKKFHFTAGTEFKVKFKFLDRNKDYVKEYLKAFNVLQLFGGIGCRSRRGGGNFIVEELLESSEIGEKEVFENICVENSNKNMLDYYKNILGKQREIQGQQYSNIVSKHSEIYLYRFNDEYNAMRFNYENILQEIGSIYKKTRNETKYTRNNNRGASPLIIKVVKDKKEYKALLVKLAGNFSLSKSNNEESNIVDEIFIKCNNNESIINEVKW